MAILLVSIFPTALARLLVFAGLRRIGGMQTALLALAEPLVAVVLAFALLGESFTAQQWIGVCLFLVSILLIRRDTGLQIADEDTWWLSLFPEAAVEGEGRPVDSPAKAE
jgi:drug/metabolite transporter (DMT)-like permease